MVSTNTTISGCALPLVFSAKSEASLKGTMKSVLRFIRTRGPEFDMLDLAWTMLRKQSAMPLRRAIAGRTREAACLALESAIKDADSVARLRPTSESNNDKKPRICGIFTGQGAQWPGMLKTLVSTMPYVRDIMAELDHSLQTLPTEYRPSWSLQEHFMLPGDSIHHAAFSQPLCCAVQIVLVRLLAAAGVLFETIVGHSSGEIACAFAAGFISASQAIRIAYLRGVVSRHASSPRGEEGAMLATGLSYEDARELCELEAFQGCVCIAASNSPDSTTVSGDIDAIRHFQGTLEEESRFARLLRVDKAYHSHHMLPCSSPYIEALVACGCAVADGADSSASPSVAWYSSVYENRRMRLCDVTAKYWTDNLVSPVMFSQAVSQAVTACHPLDAALEIGCHPALKAPCLATVSSTSGPEELPYTGCMRRGADDVDAFADALGYLWERFGLGAVDPDGFISKLVSPQLGRPIKSLASALPRYSWDHSRTYWTESRAIRAHLRGSVPHLLLGTLSANSTSSTFQWHNLVRPRDHEWLRGHVLHGQTVFPAAGYVTMALEAAIHVFGDRQIQLLELLDLGIDKAVTFEDENSLAEVNLTAKIISDPTEAERTTLSFSIDSCLARETKLSASVRGQLVVTFGPGSHHVLPPAQEEHPHMNTVDVDVFYRELEALGYEYGGWFRRIHSIRRADRKASGTLAYPRLEDEDGRRHIVLHPASLDLAFQTVTGAYSSPGDKRLRSMYVPVRVGRIALVPPVCSSAFESSDQVHFNTTNTYDKGDLLCCDIEVSDASSRAVLYQVENLVFKPLSPPSASEDHRPFCRWVWGPLVPNRLLDNPEWWATAQDHEAIPVIERVVYFYVRRFLSQLPDKHRLKAAPHHQRQIHWCEHVLAEAQQGRHPWYNASWEADTYAEVQQLCER